MRSIFAESHDVPALEKGEPEVLDLLFEIGGPHSLSPELLLGIEEPLGHDGQEQLLFAPVAEGIRFLAELRVRELAREARGLLPGFPR